CSQDVQLPITF
nr:immunoglobulin light chain junction region [Macaca mulatta]